MYPAVDADIFNQINKYNKTMKNETDLNYLIKHIDHDRFHIDCNNNNKELLNTAGFIYFLFDYKITDVGAALRRKSESIK